MTSIAITDIGSLVTADSTLGDGALGIRANAAMVVVDGKVKWVGDNAWCPMQIATFRFTAKRSSQVL